MMSRALRLCFILNNWDRKVTYWREREGEGETERERGREREKGRKEGIGRKREGGRDREGGGKLYIKPETR